MKIHIKDHIEKNALIAHLHLKVRDEFTCTIKDDVSSTLLDYEGYVPSFMPGDHYGDYVILDIELATGKILNWDSAKVARKIQEIFDTEE